MSKREWKHEVPEFKPLDEGGYLPDIHALYCIAERLEALVEVMDSEAREEEVSHLKRVICEQADALQQQRRQKEKAVEDYLALKQEMSP